MIIERTPDGGMNIRLDPAEAVTGADAFLLAGCWWYEKAERMEPLDREVYDIYMNMGARSTQVYIAAMAVLFPAAAEVAR